MTTENTSNRVNGINLNVLTETVQAIQADPELGKCQFRARNKWIEATHNCTTVSGFYGAKQEMTHKQHFELHADEPPILAGTDDGGADALALQPTGGLLYNPGGYLSDPSDAAPSEIALEFLSENHASLGLTAADVADGVRQQSNAPFASRYS